MTGSDPTMAEITAAVEVGRAGDPSAARGLLAALWERIGPAGDQLGYEALAQAFARAAKTSNTPRQLLDELVGVGDDWADGVPPDDDLTLVALRYAVDTSRSLSS